MMFVCHYAAGWKMGWKIECKELDMEGNLLASWEQVSRIVQQLQLEELRLSKNNLQPMQAAGTTEAKAGSVDECLRYLPASVDMFRGGYLDQLQRLFLNAVPDAWGQVRVFCQCIVEHVSVQTILLL